MTLHREHHEHAFVRDGIVINVLVFDGHDHELLEQARETFNADLVVCCCDHGIASIGGEWDGEKFWSIKPYPSWVKGTDEWEPPVAYLTDGGVYVWDEESVSWIQKEFIPVEDDE